MEVDGHIFSSGLQIQSEAVSENMFAWKRVRHHRTVPLAQNKEKHFLLTRNKTVNINLIQNKQKMYLTEIKDIGITVEIKVNSKSIADQLELSSI